MRMLITGVSGMLGNNLARYFRDSFSILGFYHQHPVTIQGVQARPLNLLEKSLLKRQIDLFAPDVVIHCASLTDLDFCEKNREMAFAINTETTHHLVESLKTSPAKFVFISSDAVYDGCRGEYTEEDAVSPSNVYGETKIEAEKIAAQRENSSILRTNIFGWNILSKLSLAEWFLSNLGKGNKVKGFHDVRFSALYTFTFARILEKVLKKNLKGLYNCASSTAMSKYAFAVRLAQLFGLDASKIESGSMEAFPFVAKRGKNLSLYPGKLAKALGEPLPTMEESVESFYRDFKEGIPASIKRENVFFAP